MRDAWVAPSVKRLTLDFSSGHDLTVHEFEPHMGLCADDTEPAWHFVSLSLSLSLPFALSLSKQIKKKINTEWLALCSLSGVVIKKHLMTLSCL